tara:strand:- start:342 stop:746 length:405 start_codon:yes stop_codon:yes gene_type:complete
MTHFAKVEEVIEQVASSAFIKTGELVVADVLVAEQDFIDNHTTGRWVQTSYNTRGNVHFGQDGSPDGGVALNKNFAGIGFTYVDGVGFHAPQPFLSWKLDDDTFLWGPPVAYPDDGKDYTWDENTTAWVETDAG